jgi:hypothetical protein
MRTIPTTLAAALAATGALALPASAPAQPTCTYDATTATVQLALDAPAPNGAYTLARSGSRIGWLNGRPDTGASFTACGAATVTNTDTIDVTGTPDADDLVIGRPARGEARPASTPSAARPRSS